MNKLEVTLKQHTPLIHFQHEQEGATLRASEVKPKLDRFILEKLGVNGKQIAEKKEWIIKGQESALDYKIKLAADTPIHTYNIQNRYPLFFGNMGDDVEKKAFRFCDGIIKITITAYNDEIIETIKEHIAAFFLLNNFGTRQSKGFGAFYLNQADPLYRSPIDTDWMDYRFTVDVNGNIPEQWEILFNRIELFYKTLRGGINLYNSNRENVFYMKPIIFKYAQEKGLQWDKKSIKESYYPQILAKQKKDHPNKVISDVVHFLQTNGKTKYLFKDLLGLSSTENWHHPYHKTITKECIDKSVDRFKSPIIFKPIRINDNSYDIFFKGNNIPGEYLNKKFRIKDSFHSNLTLTTYPKFDIDDFLKYAIFDVQLEELLGEQSRKRLGDKEYKNHETFETIKDIYTKIRQNKRL